MAARSKNPVKIFPPLGDLISPGTLTRHG